MYEFLRNNAMDALTFNEMSGDNHLVRNNYGGSLGGPLVGKKTFFFANFEGLRLSQAMTMTDTVPSMAEAGGDFNGSGTTVYDPASAHPNPNFDPSQPAGPKNPQILRNPFPNNVIPTTRLSPGGRYISQQICSHAQHDGRRGHELDALQYGSWYRGRYGHAFGLRRRYRFQ